jgi:hypothetical protein
VYTDRQMFDVARAPHVGTSASRVWTTVTEPPERRNRRNRQLCRILQVDSHSRSSRGPLLLHSPLTKTRKNDVCVDAGSAAGGASAAGSVGSSTCHKCDASLHVCFGAGKFAGIPGATTVQHVVIQFSAHTHTHAHAHVHTRTYGGRARRGVSRVWGPWPIAHRPIPPVTCVTGVAARAP